MFASYSVVFLQVLRLMDVFMNELVVSLAVCYCVLQLVALDIQ